jgi:[ribosomal protein S18]-alanine N-acetyltransferase
MRIFRRSLDLNLTSPREAAPADIGSIARLFHNNTHRFLGFPNADLPLMLASAPTMLLVAGDEIWAAAIGGWHADATIWLRGLALVNNLPISSGLASLLPPFHALLRSHDIRRLFYAGDEAADTWLQPALYARGYQRDTEVVVYEKRELFVPSEGNRAVRVRPVEAVDLPAVLAVDHACFDPQWNKDEGIIGPAIFEVPYFVVVEIDGAVVGYAFATTHFGGRLVHLVRIAVHPAHQGQAIGVRLLAEITAYARAIGASSLTLNTQANNTGAQRLYEWFGFRRTGEQQTVLRFDLVPRG